MARSLTPESVARLLAAPSPDARVELAGDLGLILSGSGLAPAEVALAQDIVRILSKDVVDRVRASLAHGLRHARDLPRDVALKLAADIDAVALPFLAESVVLTDEDLVALVRGGSARKQETIAARPDLKENVSAALIDHAAEPAVAILMENDSARIAEVSLTRALSRFAGSDRVKAAMVHRRTLPVGVAERLVTLVSQELQEHLLKAHALPPAVASDIVLRAREHAVIRLGAGASETELRDLVGQMHHAGRLTPSVIFRALCTGDIAFFEAAMAVKGNVPIQNAQILIHDPSRRGLDALYKQAAMPPALFAAFQAAVGIVAETGFDGAPKDLERFRARVISRVLTLTDTFNPDVADYLIGKLGDVLVHAHEGAAR